MLFSDQPLTGSTMKNALRVRRVHVKSGEDNVMSFDVAYRGFSKEAEGTLLSAL